MLPITYNSYCTACISNGFKYCSDVNTCNNYSSNCTSTLKTFVNTTGCPVKSNCSFGLNGVGFVGGTGSSVAFVGSSGSKTISVPQGNPCVITLVNGFGKGTNIQISGVNTTTYAIIHNYPYTKTF